MPGRSLNFSGTWPTRLGTGWAQMASKLCPGRHSHLKSRLISSPVHFLSSSRSEGKWGFNQVPPLDTSVMLTQPQALQGLHHVTWEVERWTHLTRSL